MAELMIEGNMPSTQVFSMSLKRTFSPWHQNPGRWRLPASSREKAKNTRKSTGEPFHDGYKIFINIWNLLAQRQILRTKIAGLPMLRWLVLRLGKTLRNKIWLSFQLIVIHDIPIMGQWIPIMGCAVLLHLAAGKTHDMMVHGSWWVVIGVASKDAKARPMMAHRPRWVLHLVAKIIKF